MATGLACVIALIMECRSADLRTPVSGCGRSFVARWIMRARCDAVTMSTQSSPSEESKTHKTQDASVSMKRLFNKSCCCWFSDMNSLQWCSAISSCMRRLLGMTAFGATWLPKSAQLLSCESSEAWMFMLMTRRPLMHFEMKHAAWNSLPLLEVNVTLHCGDGTPSDALSANEATSLNLLKSVLLLHSCSRDVRATTFPK
mmetsp:Transcript_10411/g.27776  ORF Transcript_10411/g.27776 Transcript_10411/m.27776 type:complete len:200 (-) Transcript_10411:1109-1708(-)